MARSVITPKGKQVQIEGLQELNEKMAQIMDRAVGKDVKKIWMQAALELRDAISDYAPIHDGPITYYVKGQGAREVQPGALKASVFAAYGPDDRQNVLVGVSDQVAPHGHWIEYGTEKMAAQPYFRPALTLMRDRCVSIIADGYRRLLVEGGDIAEPSAPMGVLPVPTGAEKAVAAVRARAQAAFAKQQAGKSNVGNLDQFLQHS